MLITSRHKLTLNLEDQVKVSARLDIRIRDSNIEVDLCKPNSENTQVEMTTQDDLELRAFVIKLHVIRVMKYIYLSFDPTASVVSIRTGVITIDTRNNIIQLPIIRPREYLNLCEHALKISEV